MKKSSSKRTGEAGAREAAGGRPRPPTPRAAGPNFWDEIYWFTAICLGGLILALAILPPAMVRLHEALAFESRCRQRVEVLTVKNAELGQVVNAFETDPHYREEVIRTILGVKTRDEVFLR